MTADMWTDYAPPFVPGGVAEYEQAAWERRGSRISEGWSEHDATRAYEDEMATEGYGIEREAEIG